MEKNTYIIISKDRHRDDKAYVFKGTQEEVKKRCDEIWKKDFGFDYDYPWCAGGGSYEVDYVEAEFIK